MFSAFQHSGFQNNAYQIKSGGTVPNNWMGGPIDNYYYDRIKQYRRDQAEQQRLDDLERQKLEAQEALEAKEAEIAALEAQRLQDLADQQMQAQLLALFLEAKALQEQQLRIEAAIMAFMRDEEDCMILLYSLPFM